MITPRKLEDMPPQEILKLYPCMDLDKYVMDKVLDGPVDIVEETGVSIPMFSRKLGDCYPILIMLVVDGASIEIKCDEAFFAEALHAGQIIRKTDVVTWKVSDGKFIGYGRNFPEALCKLAICRKFGIGGK